MDSASQNLTDPFLTTCQADDRVAKCLADIRQAHDDSIESKQVGSSDVVGSWVPELSQLCLVEVWNEVWGIIMNYSFMYKLFGKNIVVNCIMLLYNYMFSHVS